MPKRSTLPIALTIAGSDSGGGAGIQADLKTFNALRVHGTSAITCLTAQNPAKVWKVEAASPDMVRSQLGAVFSELAPNAVKTGMLCSARIVEVAADFLRKHRRVPVVVDPVMVSSSGAALLSRSGVKALQELLLPLAAVVTPNLHEAQILVGRKLNSVEDLRAAAREIHEKFGCAALVKGGHLSGLNQAVDVFCDASGELLLRAPFVRDIKTHGTGCTYSAAIASFMARSLPLHQAVYAAKKYITQAIAHSKAIRRHTVLNSASD